MKMGYHFSVFSLSTFLLFSAVVTATRVVLENTSCSSSCGDLKNISYPFRLQDDPVSCGDADYQLSCLNNKTILELKNSGKYYVKSISYDESIIRVVDINLNVPNATCSLPYKYLSDDELVADFRFQGYTSSLYRVYTSFMNCSRIISHPDFISVPCLSGNASHIYARVDSVSVSDLGDFCGFLSMVPSSSRTLHLDHPSYGDLLKVLALGFDLSWSIDSRDCLLSGGWCTFRDKTSACFCERKPTIFPCGLILTY